jgi:hypothetical protein
MALLTPGGAVAGSPSTLAPPDLGPIVVVRFYMTHSVVTGLLRLHFNRLSDQLNFGPPHLELVQVELSRRGSDHVHRATGAMVQRASVLLALDQLTGEYAGSQPALRQDKLAIPVTADLGHLAVAGTLQVRHGTDLATWLNDAPQFVPLSGVTIYGAGPEPLVERRAIINRAVLTAVLF